MIILVVLQQCGVSADGLFVLHVPTAVPAGQTHIASQSTSLAAVRIRLYTAGVREATDDAMVCTRSKYIPPGDWVGRTRDKS